MSHDVETPLDGVTEHYADYATFRAALGIENVGGESPMDAEVCHMASIGVDWYVFHGTGLKGYVIAYQGHAGGDILGPQRERNVTYWTTDPSLSQFAAWNLAIEFITAQVHGELKSEWESSPELAHDALLNRYEQAAPEDKPAAMAEVRALEARTERDIGIACQVRRDMPHIIDELRRAQHAINNIRYAAAEEIVDQSTDRLQQMLETAKTQ